MPVRFRPEAPITNDFLTTLKEKTMKTISVTEFDKRVDIEFGFLTHMEGMSPEKARKQAIETVSQEYQKE